MAASPLLRSFFLTIALNIFFKKSFNMRNHALLVLTFGFLGFSLDLIPFATLLLILATVLVSERNVALILMRTLDQQDAINFIFGFFTMMVLHKIESTDTIWSTIPWLSLFQIVRKPDSFKRIIRPIRVGLAPISVTLTLFAAMNQVVDSGFFCPQGVLALIAGTSSFLASIFLRPDNHEVLQLVTAKRTLDELKGPHAYCNILSTIACVILARL